MQKEISALKQSWLNWFHAVSHYNKTWCLCSVWFCLLLMFCCFVLKSALWPPTPPRSYNRRHYPAGCVDEDHCSFPKSLANIINNRSPSLSLHRSCLLPLHLSLGSTVGSDYWWLIVEERGGWAIEGGSAFITETWKHRPWGTVLHIHITCHATEHSVLICISFVCLLTGTHTVSAMTFSTFP